MRELSRTELEEQLRGHQNQNGMLDLSERLLCDMDLSGRNLSRIDFTKSAFHRVTLDQADFSYSTLENALCEDVTLRGTNFHCASLKGTALRFCDMTGSDITGADLYCAVLEHAKLDGIRYDDQTKWFRMHCPGQGALLGYKKCVNDRLVQLLIPADAKRTSATLPSCRCSKAKVLTIKSFDYTQSFTEAWSLVDENFVYRVGEWVEVKNFNEDRWMDSTTGIHFWLTREEAKAY